MNYLIFGCIGLGIIVLILLFSILDKIQQSVNSIENDSVIIKRTLDDIEQDIRCINEHIHNIEYKFTEKEEIGE